MKTLLPLPYRWFRANGVDKLIPWHFIDETEGNHASRQFAIECEENRRVLIFASRQDCEDFAGFEVVDGSITSSVIYYHPSFSGTKEPNLIFGEYPDFWTFLRVVVIADMEDWASEEGIADLETI